MLTAFAGVDSIPLLSGPDSQQQVPQSVSHPRRSRGPNFRPRRTNEVRPLPGVGAPRESNARKCMIQRDTDALARISLYLVNKQGVSWLARPTTKCISAIMPRARITSVMRSG